MPHEDFVKYKQYFTNSFIDLNKNIKWCPGKDCGMVCESKLGEVVDIQCTCGTSFCFGCNKQAHTPMACEQIEVWDKKVADGAGEMGDGWIKLNTKPCPKCKVPIEKNQGCMHITCTKCGHGFCWLCMGGKESHGGSDGHVNQCNNIAMVKQRGFQVDVAGRDNGTEETEYEMIRIEHFANRYREHQKSIQFAIKRLATIRSQIDMLLESNQSMSPKDFEFLLDIAGLVVAARRSLSYTYPFRYYLKGENKQRYFDFIQGDLEQSLERLNGKNEEDWLEYLDTD